MDSWSVCSQLCFLAARSRQPPNLNMYYLPQEVGSCIFGSVLSSGLATVRTDNLACKIASTFLWSFKWVLILGMPQEGMKECSCVWGFLCLVIAACWTLPPLPHFSVSDLTLSFNVYCSPRPDCCCFTSVLPNGVLHLDPSLLSHPLELWQVPDCVCISRLCYFSLPTTSLLALICPPAGVSMCGSLRCVFVLSRESFVEL